MSRKATEEHYQLSPNPASDVLQLVYAKPGEQTASVQLSDVSGGTVLNASFSGTSGTLELDLRKLRAGMYLYRITEGGSLRASGKISKL